MRKAKKINKTTMLNKEYMSSINQLLGLCPLCPPNKGCNRNRDKNNNWKKHRKNQWYNKTKEKFISNLVSPPGFEPKDPSP